MEIEATEVVSGTAALGESVVLTNESGASCGLDLVEGETWVLQFGGNEVASLCSASTRIERDDDPWLVALRHAAATAR